MYDLTTTERAMLSDMASAGHVITENEHLLLRRVIELMPPPEEPDEYPKMLYPDGISHEADSERHLIGKPKGFVVHSKEEEDELLGKNPDELKAMATAAGEDPNARPGPTVEAIATDASLEPQREGAWSDYQEQAETRIEAEHSDIDHSENATLGGKYEPAREPLPQKPE